MNLLKKTRKTCLGIVLSTAFLCASPTYCFATNQTKPASKLQPVESNIEIHQANKNDLNNLVYLAMQRHHDYEKLQNIFWHEADDAEQLQKKYFQELLNQTKQNKPVFFIATNKSTQEPIGIIMAQEHASPPVYNSGRITYLIDDFYVSSQELWNTVGKKLLVTMQDYLEAHGVTQIIVISADADKNKTKALQDLGPSYQPLSTWYIHETAN